MENLEQFLAVVGRVSEATKVPLPEGYKYRYAPYKCWKCKGEMIAFVWPEDEWSDESSVPPEPIPKTVRVSYTQMSDSEYWANVCPHCEAVQGDFYVFSEPDSPLFGSRTLFRDDKESFESDMMKIAQHYASLL